VFFKLAYFSLHYTSPWAGFLLTSVVMIGADCTGEAAEKYGEALGLLEQKVMK
jgi:hypothetical protein